MWRPLGCADSERFALVWESEELKALNNTLFSFVKNKVSYHKAALLTRKYSSYLANVIWFCCPESSLNTIRVAQTLDDCVRCTWLSASITVLLSAKRLCIVNSPMKVIVLAASQG